MMKDLISVIIPVYNVAPYLKKCLKSVLRQTYTNLEVIIVDDGSKDNSGEICKEIAKKDRRVTVIQQANAGVCAARNTAIKAVTGKWIVFVDGDDWLPKDAIAALHTEAVKENAQYVVGRFQFVEPFRNGKDTTLPMQISADGGDSSDAETFFSALRYFGFACKKIFDADIIRQHNIRFIKGMIISEDTAFNLEYLTYCRKIVSMDRIVYCYNCLRDNNSASRYYPERSYWAKDCLSLYKDAVDVFVKDEKTRNRLVSEYARLRICRDIRHHVRECEEKQAIDQILQTYELLCPYVTVEEDLGDFYPLLKESVKAEKLKRFYDLIREESNELALGKLRSKLRSISAKVKMFWHYGM